MVQSETRRKNAVKVLVMIFVVRLASFFGAMPVASPVWVATRNNVVMHGVAITNARLVIVVLVASWRHQTKINVVRLATATVVRLAMSTVLSVRSVKRASD